MPDIVTCAPLVGADVRLGLWFAFSGRWVHQRDVRLGRLRDIAEDAPPPTGA